MAAVPPTADRVFSPAAPRPRRSLRMTPDERRADLIATTLSLLGSRPLSEITPEMIASAAGVSRALFYRYFAGLSEAYREAFAMVTGMLRSGLEGLSWEGSLREQLEVGLKAYIDFAIGYREAYIAIFTQGAGNAGGALSEEVEAVRQTIMRLIVERAGGSESPVYELTARTWMGAAEVAVLKWLEHQSMDSEAMRRWLLDQFVAMVAVSAQTDPVSAEVLAKFKG